MKLPFQIYGPSYAAMLNLVYILKSIYVNYVQGLAKRRSPGLVNFVAAVAYHFCLAFPAAFTQPGTHLLAAPCRGGSVGFAALGRNQEVVGGLWLAFRLRMSVQMGRLFCRTLRVRFLVLFLTHMNTIPSEA